MTGTRTLTHRPQTPARVPRLIAWGALTGVSEVVRFAGMMTLLCAQGIDLGARRVMGR